MTHSVPAPPFRLLHACFTHVLLCAVGATPPFVLPFFGHPFGPLVSDILATLIESFRVLLCFFFGEFLLLPGLNFWFKACFPCFFSHVSLNLLGIVRVDVDVVLVSPFFV